MSIYLTYWHWYTYDPLSRLTCITTMEGLQESYSYDAEVFAMGVVENYKKKE